MEQIWLFKQTHWADKIYFNPFWIALHEHDLTRLSLSTVRLKGGADLGSSFTPDRISQRSTKMHFDQTTSYFGGILKALIFIIFLSFIQGNAVFCYVNVVYERPIRVCNIPKYLAVTVFWQADLLPKPFLSFLYLFSLTIWSGRNSICMLKVR